MPHRVRDVLVFVCLFPVSLFSPFFMPVIHFKWLLSLHLPHAKDLENVLFSLACHTLLILGAFLPPDTACSLQVWPRLTGRYVGSWVSCVPSVSAGLCSGRHAFVLRLALKHGWGTERTAGGSVLLTQPGPAPRPLLQLVGSGQDLSGGHPQPPVGPALCAERDPHPCHCLAAVASSPLSCSVSSGHLGLPAHSATSPPVWRTRPV